MKRGPRPGAHGRLASLAITAILGAAGLSAPQEPAPPRSGQEAREEAPAPRKPGLDEAIDAFFELRSGTRRLVYLPAERRAIAYCAGDVDWSYQFQGEPVRMRADKLVLRVRLPEKLEAGAGKERGEREPEKEKQKEQEKQKEKERNDEESGLPAIGEVEDFTVYGEGNVRLEITARRTVLEADEFYYEHLTRFGVARGVRLRTTVSLLEGLRRLIEAEDLSLDTGELTLPPLKADGLRRSALVVRAQVLRMYGFQFFEGEGVEATSCDYGVPHYSLGAASALVYPIDSDPEEVARLRRLQERVGPAAERGVQIDAVRAQDYLIDPESSWLEVGDLRLVPLPVSRWDTRWSDHLPIRTIDIGRSSKFGNFGALNWNLNYFLKLAPLENFLPLSLVEREARLGFETTYMEKRGFGYGPNAQYGADPQDWLPWQLELNTWKHYGEAQYFAIRDHADEDRSTDLSVPREDRYWGHAWHRQSVPYLGLFDLEYSNLSDRAFLGEFFESVAEEEKEQENLIYWRRNFRDNVAFTGLYQFRIDDFVTETERLPEGKLFVFQQPLLRTGLYSDLKLQGAELRVRPDDDLGLATRSFDRYDVLSELAYPVGIPPYLQVRPFGLARYTYYGEVLDPGEGSEDRASFGGGVSVSQQWSRAFKLAPDSFASRWLQTERLKHVIIPRVGYLNIPSDDLEPEATLGLDATDSVDLRESISFSLTNEVLGRFALPPRPRKPPAPSEKREGEDEGVAPLLGRREERLEEVPYETRSLLDSEVSFVLFPQPARDNDGDRSSLVRFDNTARVVQNLKLRAFFELDPNNDYRGERIAASATYEVVPDRLALGVGDRFSRGQTNVVSFFGRWKLSDRWFFEGYYARDFEEQRDVEYRFSLSRILHCWVLSVEYVEDVGEDRNRSVRFSFDPLALFERRTERRGVAP